RRQRIVAELLEDGRGQLDLARRRAEAERSASLGIDLGVVAARAGRRQPGLIARQKLAESQAEPLQPAVPDFFDPLGPILAEAPTEITAEVVVGVALGPR